MSNSKDGSQKMSRRMALTSAALAFAAAAGTAVTRANAQQKLTQAAAKYQDQPKEKQTLCRLRQLPSRRMHANSCKGRSARMAGACCLRLKT